MRFRFIGSLLIFTALICLAKDRKQIPLAPLPARVLSAKTVLVVNGGGNDLAYDALYASMKNWSRFKLVNAQADADLIIDIRYVTEDGGTRVWSSTNTYTNQTQVHSRHITDPQLILTIIDPATKEALWSTVEHRRLARLQRNKEKETVNAADKLVDNLKARLGTN